jgi:outer membrane protein TolC
MAITRLDEQEIELDEERDTARAGLDVLLGRRPDEELEIAGNYAAARELPPIEELERLAILNRPELTGLRTQIEKSKNEGVAARLAMKPDFTAALGYMVMPAGSTSRNAYMAEMTMNLPWLNRDRHEGESKQADAATEVAQADLEARTSAVFLEVQQAQIATLAAEKRVKLYRDTLLPQAEAAFKASTAAYQIFFLTFKLPTTRHCQPPMPAWRSWNALSAFRYPRYRARCLPNRILTLPIQVL